MSMRQTIQILAIVGGVVTAAGLLIGAGMWVGESRAASQLNRAYFEGQFQMLRQEMREMRAATQQDLRAIDERVTRLEAQGGK